MLSAQDLIDIRNIAVAAALFTNEDFIKATEVHSKKLELLEKQHKVTMERLTETNRIAIENNRNKLQAEEVVLRKQQQIHKDEIALLEKQKIDFQNRCSGIEADLQKRTQELVTRDESLKADANRQRIKGVELVAKEAQLRAMEEQLNQERLAIQAKLTRLKEFAA